MKINIVYWSGTGNTEAMANAVAEGAAQAGASVEVKRVEYADAKVLDCDVVLFGCPAMGAEELEESEFEPFFSAVENKLAGRKVGLFGSYEWADGEWMRSWQERTENDGAVMIANGLAVYGMPDAQGIAACRELGALAAKQL